MADNEQGVGSFLDRITSAIDGAGEDDAETPDTQNPEPSTQNTDPAPDTSFDDLGTSDAPAPKPASDDPLDNLEPVDTAQDSGDEPATSDEPATGDFFDTLDAADRKAVEAYIDEQVAKEITESEAAGGAFKRIKAENRDLSAQLRELSAKVEQGDADALTAATRKIEELEGQLKTVQETDSVLRLEETDAWKSEVLAPLQDIVAASDAIAERYEVDPDRLANVLEIDDRRKLSEAVTDLLGDDVLDADKFDLYDLARKVQGVYGKRDALRSNADEALKEAEAMAAERKEADALAARQTRAEAAKQTVDRLNDKARFIVDLVGEEAMSEVSAAIEETDFGALSETDRAFARISAKAIAPLAREVKRLEAELQRASDELVARRKASPGSSGSSSSDPAPAEEEGSQGSSSFRDRVNNRLSEIMGA